MKKKPNKLDNTEINVSPSARRAAREYNVDLSKIKGNGPNGRILKQDVIEEATPSISELDEQPFEYEIKQAEMKAIIFDCDGVLADTERDGHRVAFNKAFAIKGLQIEWRVELYGELLEVSGGKERMRHYFESYGWPCNVTDNDALLKELHELKTDFFLQIIESGQIPLRPGVARLIDEAITADVSLAICSTSQQQEVNLLVQKLLGSERKAHFNVILAGNIVSRKKPHPEIYNLALKRLSLESSECVVIEDNRIGMLAAKAAGMHCVVTTNRYSKDEDFIEADLVVSELGDPPNVLVTLETIRNIVGKG